MRRTLIALVALLGCSGCVVVTYGRYSRATLEDPEALAMTEGQVTWFGERDGDTFRLRETHLQLIAMNEQVVLSVWGFILPFLPLPGGDNASELYARSVTRPPAFLLGLSLRSKREGLSLSASEVLLRRADGTLAPPRGYWGLAEGSHCRGFARAPQVAAPQSLAGTPYPIPRGEDACITWLFDGSPPAPGEAFALELTGLRDGADPLLRGSVRFQLASSWTLEWPLF